jgi:hypothetical protein
MKIFECFLNCMGKMDGNGGTAGARAVAGAEIFDKLEPELHRNLPAPQHCLNTMSSFRTIWQKDWKNSAGHCKS